jgi:predicted O-methyltransferase YrrM
MMSAQPFVSCIMPTRDRRRFVPTAIAYFQRQDYASKELIIVDDGDDNVSDLVAGDGSIRYVRLGRRASVGLKRNYACDVARGDLIVHWDDDDWHAPDRIRRQVSVLQGQDVDVCGVNRLHFFDLSTGRAWVYVYPPGERLWLAGGTLAYRAAFWRHNRFEDIDVGEDAYFVGRAPPERVAVMHDQHFYVATIHPQNISPKLTNTSNWHACSLEQIQQLVGPDMADLEGLSNSAVRSPTPSLMPATQVQQNPRSAQAIHNVYACLVHEQVDCVIDLVRNLHCTDPSSTILLYNGSPNSDFLELAFPFASYNAIKHPHPRPTRWGWLHDYAVDAMRFALSDLHADTLTIVDSDQLAVRPGYASFLGGFLSANPDIGMLVSSDAIQPSNTRVEPALQAWRELERWTPLLNKFPHGRAHFVRWTFWPASVFTAQAMRDIVSLFDHDADLARLLTGTSMWATEEVLFPTLTALLGYRLAVNPCSNELVRFRTPCTAPELRRAFVSPDVYWIHPVARTWADPARVRIRAHVNSATHAQSNGHVPMLGAPDVVTASQTSAADRSRPLLFTLPVLERMRSIAGWLDDDEADALLAAAASVISTNSAARLVEIGSYCGRGTVVLGSAVQHLSDEAHVYAIDPHDGVLGARDQDLISVPPSYDILCSNLARFQLARHVSAVCARAPDVPWDDTDLIDLLLVDGLHDYASVSADFAHFAPHIRNGGLVLFHDCAAYFPGVQILVDELRRSGAYGLCAQVNSMAVLEKLGVPQGW